MRVIPSDELKKMARSIVDEYLGNNTSLAEGIAKTALSQELNPDQIKNLVTLANVAAHTTLFDKKADDKVIEFEPADPVDVMRRVYKTATPVETPTVSAEPPMSRAEDMFGDLSEVLDKVKDMLGRCPTDAEEPAPTPVEVPEEVSPKKHQMMIIRIRKVAEHIEDQQLQKAAEYREELDALATKFAKLYGPDLEEFEKDAVAWRGVSSYPVIGDLRKRLRMPSFDPTRTMEKRARLVDTETENMRSLDKLVRLTTEYNDLINAREFLQEKVGQWL